MEKLKKEVEKELENAIEQGINQENVDYVYRLIDIHKDIKNEEYWKVKEENYMRYRESGGYGNYNEGGYGEYGEGGSYGRRGVKGTGRGRSRRYRDGGGYGNYGGDEKEEMLEMMKEHYQGYQENMSYGAEGQGMQALNKMFESAYEFVEMLSEDVKSEEEAQLAKKWLKKIGQVM